MPKSAIFNHCFFRLDAGDRIVDWGGAQWDSFAEANGAPALAKVDLTGDSLFAHVAGRATKIYLAAFFSQTRALSQPQLRFYRCDSPAVKRLMQMRVSWEIFGGLFLAHRLVADAPAAREIVVVCRPGGRPRYLRCSICNRLALRNNDDWREAEAWAPVASSVRAEYAVCENCAAGAVELKDLWPARIA